MVREIDRPTPMPCRLVVMNGWNSCAVISGEMPAPVSVTEIFDHVIGGERRRNHKLAALGILHRLDGIAHQVQQNLLYLHLVGEHVLDVPIEVKEHAHTAIFCADERQGACFLDKLFDVLDLPLAFTTGNEIA